MVRWEGENVIDVNPFCTSRLRLTKLNEEIGADREQGGSGNDETYVDVMKDFSNFAINQPHRLQRPKVEESEEI